jgi:hypothetical protein
MNPAPSAAAFDPREHAVDHLLRSDSTVIARAARELNATTRVSAPFIRV